MSISSSRGERFNSLENIELHGPYFAEDVRPGDPISATLTVGSADESSNEVQLPVWRLSPLGVELLLDNPDFQIEKGTQVALKLVIGDQVSILSGLTIDIDLSQPGRRILGIRIVQPPQNRSETAEQRQQRRWSCSEQFFPTAIAVNPARFNDFIYFQIRNISRDGLQLSTSLRNKFIMQGMRFEAIVNLPMVSRVQLIFKVLNVRVSEENGRKVLSLGATIEHNTPIIREALAQYLIQFGNLDSLQELRDEKLALPSVAPAVSFSFVRTSEEYKEVLRFRREIYVRAGKVPPETRVEDMGDIYDTRARLVIGTYRGEIVSSARMAFHEYDDRLEQEEYANLDNHSLPRRDEMVEIMRVCTRPDFRGSDLLLAMFKFMALTTAQSKRKYIILSTTEDLVSLYEKIGCAKIGVSFPHTKLNGTVHHLLLGNVADAISGKTLNPLYWNIIYGDVTAYLEQYGLFDFSGMMQVRMFCYRLLKPLAFYLRQRVNKPRRIKQVEKSRIRAALKPGQKSA